MEKIHNEDPLTYNAINNFIIQQHIAIINRHILARILPQPPPQCQIACLRRHQLIPALQTALLPLVSDHRQQRSEKFAAEIK
jgi:hypothetical protein